MDRTFQPAAAAAVELRTLAHEAAQRAYVPYSSFRVGAAVRFADGSVVTGCNVESASYPVSLCAERTALARAVAEGRDLSSVEHIAVDVAGPEGSPCGMCRQFIAELAPQAQVSFMHGGEYVTEQALALLPGAFLPQALGK